MSTSMTHSDEQETAAPAPIKGSRKLLKKAAKLKTWSRVCIWAGLVFVAIPFTIPGLGSPFALIRIVLFLLPATILGDWARRLQKKAGVTARRHMNTRQRLVIWCAAGAGVLMFLFPPWTTGGGHWRYGSISLGPLGADFCYPILFLQWVVLVGIAGACFYGLRGSPRKRRPRRPTGIASTVAPNAPSEDVVCKKCGTSNSNISPRCSYCNEKL